MLDEDLLWLTNLGNFRRASTSSLEMHSTLSLTTCTSESEEDDDEQFEDIHIPDDHDTPRILLDEDQGNTVMLFTDTIYLMLSFWMPLFILLCHRCF